MDTGQTEDTAPPRLETTATVAVPRARFRLRAIAFMLDFILVFFLIATLLGGFILPRYFAAEWTEITAAGEEMLLTAGESFEAGLEAAPARNLSEDAHRAVNFIYFFFIAVFWLYFTLSEIATGGATLGKRMFSMRAVHSPELSRTGVLDSFLRNGIKSLTLPVLPLLLINIVVALVNPRRRALHDLLCRTVVVDDLAVARLAHE